MADIELVIRIDENLYKGIYSDAEIMIYGGMRSGKTLLATLLRTIRNGTPLPKGHGRIGDLDALREEVSSWDMNDYEPSDFIDEIDRADTIIEADKEQTDGKV